MTSPTSRTGASAVPDLAEQPSGVDPAAVAQQAFADPDALNRLRAITTLRDELEVVETAAVRDAVQRGATWSEIADLLGVTKQSAHRRFSVRINRAPATPQRADVALTTEPRIVVTAQARRAVRAARAAARALGHAEVDTSHLLLGLLADIAGRALEAIGVDFDGAREVVTANQP